MTLKGYLKESLINLAHSREYELIPSWSMEKQPLVRHLKTLFEKYRVDCVFDVGGNMGQYHDLLRDDVGFTGPIISFEPVSKYIAMLKAKAASDARWKICDFALGSKNETATINVTKSPGLNSFLSPRKDVLEGFWSDDAISSTEEVRIQMLDAHFAALKAELGFQRPYLKLDTQGFDLEAMRGAQNCLSQFSALQTEASVKPLYAGMPTYQDVMAYTHNAGFELSGIFPVSHDDALRLIEFDCVMVGKAVAAAK